MPEAVFAAVVAAAASQPTASNHSAGDIALSSLWRQRNLPAREAWSRSTASVSMMTRPSGPTSASVAVASFPSDSALRSSSPMGSARGASNVGREMACVPHIPQEDPRLINEVNQEVGLTSKVGLPQRKSSKRLQREERARLLDKERRGTESSDDNDLVLLEGEEQNENSQVQDSMLNSDHPIGSFETDKLIPKAFDSQEMVISESPELSPQLSFMTRQQPELQPPEISPRISPGSFPPRPHLRTPPGSTAGGLAGAEASSSASSSPSSTLSPPSSSAPEALESDGSPRRHQTDGKREG